MAQLARLPGSKTRNGTWTEKLTRQLGTLEFHARENLMDFFLNLLSSEEAMNLSSDNCYRFTSYLYSKIIFYIERAILLK